jgi:hypothetical protein
MFLPTNYGYYGEGHSEGCLSDAIGVQADISSRRIVEYAVATGASANNSIDVEKRLLRLQPLGAATIARLPSASSLQSRISRANKGKYGPVPTTPEDFADDNIVTVIMQVMK